MTDNIYKVPNSQWRKWSAAGREMFNAVIEDISLMHGHFLHPQTAEMPFEQWKTIAWNAAWIAATNATELDLEI